MAAAVSGEPFLFARQRTLIDLLAALGGRAGGREFQLLLFRHCEPQAEPAYEFVPHTRGPWSFTAQADRVKLIERDVLDAGDGWTLTRVGHRLATPGSDLAEFSAEHRSLRKRGLVADTYRRFPFFATHSTDVATVLGQDRFARNAIAALRIVTFPRALTTIGYEGHSLESYLGALLRAGVTLLCDVRRNPLSRKFGFAKRALASGCAAVGIRYEHLPSLGIASEQRRSLDTQDDYDALFEVYERETLPHETRALATIAGWVRHGDRAALTCYEHLPGQCHRHCVGEALQSRYGESFTPHHL